MTDTPTAQSAAQSSASVELRFSTLNLLNFACPPYACYEFDNIYSTAQWQQKTAWLARIVSATAPDVLALQEVFSVAALREVLAPLGYSSLVTAGVPKLVDDHVFLQPVVALATRHPVLAVAEVQVPVQAALALGLSDFQFSRTPLRVVVDCPQLGAVNCYVVHLKSRRAVTLTSSTMLPAAEALSRWAACVQRGHEAGLLLEAIAEQHALDGLPVLLCGDFNDELSSPLLQVLLSPQPQLQLQDSWLLAQHQPSHRPATHYYGARGSVLDYLLLSQHFAGSNNQAQAQVRQVTVQDQHLIRPVFAQEGYSSDHALVTVHLYCQG